MAGSSNYSHKGTPYKNKTVSHQNFKKVKILALSICSYSELKFMTFSILLCLDVGNFCRLVKITKQED